MTTLSTIGTRAPASTAAVRTEASTNEAVIRQALRETSLSVQNFAVLVDASSKSFAAIKWPQFWGQGQAAEGFKLAYEGAKRVGTSMDVAQAKTKAVSNQGNPAQTAQITAAIEKWTEALGSYTASINGGMKAMATAIQFNNRDLFYAAQAQFMSESAAAIAKIRTAASAFSTVSSVSASQGHLEARPSAEAKLEAPLKALLAKTRSDVVVKVIVWLPTIAPSSTGTRQERIAALKKANEAQVEAFRPLLEQNGAKLLNATWIDQRLLVDIPAGNVLKLAKDSRVEQVTLPTALMALDSGAV